MPEGDTALLRELRTPTLVDLTELRVNAFVDIGEDPFEFASPIGDDDDG